MTSHPQLERDIESRSRKRAEAAGKRLMKFTSPGHAFVPDDILLAPIPEWLRPVVAKYFRFVEFKRTGAKPTAPQKREHERLRSLGFTVEVVDSVEAADRVFAEMGDA
jgi:hypothetical protein